MVRLLFASSSPSFIILASVSRTFQCISVGGLRLCVGLVGRMLQADASDSGFFLFVVSFIGVRVRNRDRNQFCVRASFDGEIPRQSLMER